jgi:cell fate (sporulation/competence/biofilm development) regulator YlbF (YheA/YmcA/DUF963 family)
MSFATQDLKTNVQQNEAMIELMARQNELLQYIAETLHRMETRQSTSVGQQD